MDHAASEASALHGGVPEKRTAAYYSVRLIACCKPLETDRQTYRQYLSPYPRCTLCRARVNCAVLYTRAWLIFYTHTVDMQPVAATVVRRMKYMAERRHIVNNLHQGRSTSTGARRRAADAIFKCSLNKRSQLPVPLSISGAADRRHRGTGLTSNGAQVTVLSIYR